VDLATALEAILAGGEGDNEALTFRNPADDQAQTPALQRPRPGRAGTAQAGTVGHTQP
jgi:hypothetical protein